MCIDLIAKFKLFLSDQHGWYKMLHLFYETKAVTERMAEREPYTERRDKWLK
jgi:hypothetical protein